MYFETIFNNYSSIISTYIAENKLKSVDKIYDLRNKCYRSNYENDQEYSLFIGHDIRAILMKIFGFDSISCSKFIDLVTDLDMYFASKNKLHNLSMYKGEISTYHLDNVNAVFLKKHFSFKENRSVSLFSLKAEISIDITDNGLKIIHSDFVFDHDFTPIVDNDCSKALIEAIELFRQRLGIKSGLNTPVTKLNIDIFKNLSLADVFSATTQQDQFKYPDANYISTTLDSINFGNPKPYFGMEQSIMMISTCSSAFIDIMKKYFNASTFEQFSKGFNLYHNYNKLISKKYAIIINFSENHPLYSKSAEFNISLGDFVITFSEPSKINNYNSFKIEHKSKYTSTTSNIYRGKDLSKFYEFVHSFVVNKISKSLEKPLSDISLKDFEVLMMQTV